MDRGLAHFSVPTVLVLVDLDGYVDEGVNVNNEVQAAHGALAYLRLNCSIVNKFVLAIQNILLNRKLFHPQVAPSVGTFATAVFDHTVRRLKFCT